MSRVATEPARISQRPRAGMQERLDVPLLVVATVLLVFGLVMNLSASSVRSTQTTGWAFTLFARQVLWAVLGAVALFVGWRIDPKRLRGWSYATVPIAWALLVMTLIPGIGTRAGGATRWIAIGPVTFQPSEFAKLAIIVAGADVLSRKLGRLDDWRHLALPFLAAVGVTCVLVLIQPDFGTMLIIAASAMVLAFLAGTPTSMLVGLAGTGLLLGIPLMLNEGYRRSRVFAFLGGQEDCLNAGYQSCQGLVSLGSGNIFGLGLGSSRQKYLFLPNPDTDFIFAIIGEETGLVGTLTVLMLFGMLAIIGVRIARRASDPFGFLVASGITAWITIQAMVNVGAVTGMLPITGVPLPLISVGGTSLLMSLAGLGLVAAVGRRSPPRPGRARSG